MAMHQGPGGQSMMMRQQDAPVVCQVALLPAKATEENINQPVQGEFMMSSVERYNAHGEHQTVAEYLKYLVEQACSDIWLLLICRRAQSTTGVVKLCYGCGYETTVVIGNADARGEPKKLALGVSVNTTNATVGQIAGLWMSGSESIWNHVNGQVEMNMRSSQDAGNVCVYVRTGPRRFMIPALSANELHSRQRMIRVWPDPDNAMFIERMEELSSESLSNAPRPAVASAPPATSKEAPKEAPPKAAKKSSLTDQQTEEAKKPPAKKDGKATAKKRSVSTDEGAEENKSKKSKKKQDKDTSKPKRALTVYNFFMKDNRARITKENPEATAQDVTKILVSQYNNLSGEELKAYKAQVEADKKRYAQEMKAWEAKQASENAKKEAEDKEHTESDDASDDNEDDASDSDDESSNDESKKPVAAAEATPKVGPKKKKKDPTKPKGGKNAYNFFVTEQRNAFEEAHPGKNWNSIRTLLTDAFHALTEEEREKYDALAATDKEERGKEMAEWMAEKAAHGDSESDEEVEKKKAKRKKKDPDAPKRARTAYIFFSNDKRKAIQEAHPEAGFGDMGKLIGSAFKAMDAEEKAKYDAMAAADKIRANKELEEYKARKSSGTSHDENAADGDDTAQISDGDDSDKKVAAKPSAEKPKETTTESTDAEPAEEIVPAEAKASPKSKSKKRKHSEDKSVEEAAPAPAEKSTSKKKKKKKKKHRKEEAM